MAAPTVLRAAIPKQAALNMANAVEIHLWLCDDKNIPEKTACRVAVENMWK